MTATKAAKGLKDGGPGRPQKPKENPKAPKDDPKAPGMRILKVGTCPSLSRGSTLTYHIGCNSESEVHFRIWGNTGGGIFAKVWVPWSRIEPALETCPVTAGTLKRSGAFRGKSANTPGFMLAVLKVEGLVEPLEGQGHMKADPARFLKGMEALIASGTAIASGTETQEPEPGKPAKPPAAKPKG
jgi:hypothetical protein